MKSNKSSKLNRKNLKSAMRVLTIVICISVAINLIVVEVADALVVLIAIAGAFVGGVIIGWITATRHDSSSPDALIISEQNYVVTWNDFIEEWNNDYIGENTNLHNYMMMFNLTYLDSVRRAEHDVASYVHLTNWTDVESNMTSLVEYKENITGFIVATLHGYNRVEVSILQHIYDTDVWSYTTPMKFAKCYLGEHHYWLALDVYGITNLPSPPTSAVQYKVPFGTYPVGYNGDYDVGDKFYVTFMYVPNGNFIILKDLETNVETTYTSGVHDLQGERNEVINVTICDSGNPNFDNTGVYLFGVPTDFDVLEDNLITYDTGLTYSSESQSLLFEKSKLIESIYLTINDGNSYNTDVYIDSILKESVSGTSRTVVIDDYASNITITMGSGDSSYITSITTEGYIYHDMTGGLKIDMEHVESVYVTDNLSARGRVGLDWMVNSYKSIYESMIVQSRILWNVYHSNGWYSTDDIPSEFLVAPPDIIFDNLDALINLPLDKAQAIYYAWMTQLIDFYDENPDYAETYDDTDMTVFDDGIIFNASLIHGGKTIFSNHEIYISPLLGDLELCKNNSYNLTQKIFIYDITGTYIYYGYVGDNLTIHNITIDDVGTDCVTLGRQTMHDFLMGKYGFSISFPAEWEFPAVSGGEEIYTGIAIGLICFGVPIWLLGGDKFKKFGILMVIVGGGIIVFLYVIPAIIDFFVFW